MDSVAAIMESEKQGQTQTQTQQGAEFLSASSYQEQELRHSNTIGDGGRDESAQAGDFLRGSRGDEPPSALMQVLQGHVHGDGEKTTSATKSTSTVSAASAGAAAAGEKPGDALQTEKGMTGDLAGGEANGEAVEQASSPHHMPHQEVPQPGQYTDMDAVVEMVALADT